MTSLDGLCDEEYRDRYERACRLRGIAPDTRDCWDLADWMRFLHEMYYKPCWRADIETESSFGHIRYLLRLEVFPCETPSGPQRLSSKVILHPEMIRTETDASSFLRRMIDHVEHKITTAWLILAPIEN